MNRRQVLTLLSSAGIGGYLGGGSEDPANTSRTTTSTRTTGTTATPQSTSEATSTKATTEETTTAEPPKIGEPLPSECPMADDDVQRVCYPGTDSPMAMKPSSDSVSLPTGTISFTLANETAAMFEINYYDWNLHKRVDGEWYRIAPGLIPAPLHRLPPGESHTWNVTVDNSNLGEEIVPISDDDYLHLRGLGGGTYAFGTDGWFQGQDYTIATAFVARFDIEGDQISLSLTDSVESVEREDETVVVRMPKVEHPRQVTVTRVGDPPEEPERVVAEQAIRTTPLRNALAAFEEGVEAVRVENATDMANFTFDLDQVNYVEYRETTYGVQMERQETTG